MFSQAVYIAPTAQKGRGVFAQNFIPEGSLIETCPVLIMPKAEEAFLEKTLLYNYYFEWGNNAQQVALALGYGSIYNHSYQPNAEYVMDFERDNLLVYAIRDIFAGQEICFNYNGDAEDQSPIWFEPK